VKQHFRAWPIAIAFGALACLPFARPAHADTIWNSDWLSSAPTSMISYWSPPAVAFASNGDVLLGSAADNTYGQYVRIGAGGELRWVANLPFTGTNAMFANADGGALISAYDYSSSAIVRLDASGAKLWSRTMFAGWIVQPSADRIVTVGSGLASALDATTGNVVWQHDVGRDSYDGRGGVVADAQGNVYTTGIFLVNQAFGGFRTQKLDSNGNEVWSTTTSGANGAIIGGNATMLYLQTNGMLRGVRMVDGSIAWSVPHDASSTPLLLSDDSAREPIVFGATTIQRLAADTGQPRWTQPVAGDPASARIVGGAILTTGAGKFVKLDQATGAIAWSKTKPTYDAAGNYLTWFGFGGLRDGNVLSVGQAEYPLTVGNAPAFLQSISFATGDVLGVVSPPVVAQGMLSGNAVDASGALVSVGVSQRASGVDLRMRRLDPATGAVMWQVFDPVNDLGPGKWFYMPTPSVTFAGNSIATSMALNSGGCSNAASGGARISLHDASNGTRRWRTFLTDVDRACSYVYEPKFDTAGNVYVSVNGQVHCQNNECFNNSVYKLSAANGQILWHDDSGADRYVRDFAVFDNIVVVGGPFDSSSDTLRGLSGASGAVQWTTDVFAGYAYDRYLFKVDDSHVVIVATTATSTSWAKLDVATGAVLWNKSVSHQECDGLCFANSPTILPGGDLLVHDGLDDKPLLRRFHNDGSGIVDEWIVGANTTSQRAWINRAEPDTNGLWNLDLRRGPRNNALSSVHFFARFDPANGTLVGQQAWFAYSNDPYETFVYRDLLKQTGDDRFLMTSISTRTPQPTTSGVGLVDTSVTAHGNLAIRAELVGSTSIGASVSMHVRVTYSGDQPLHGVTVRATMPWQSGIGAAACATSAASNCVLDTSSGAVFATFDIQPGGSIDITGQLKVLAGSTDPTLTATTYGPLGLSEPDTLDNFTRAEVGVFADGFDSH
jgi:outer membrane protein assembly factor BamB